MFCALLARRVFSRRSATRYACRGDPDADGELAECAEAPEAQSSPSPRNPPVESTIQAVSEALFGLIKQNLVTAALHCLNFCYCMLPPSMASGRAGRPAGVRVRERQVRGQQPRRRAARGLRRLLAPRRAQRHGSAIQRRVIFESTGRWLDDLCLATRGRQLWRCAQRTPRRLMRFGDRRLPERRPPAVVPFGLGPAVIL